MAEQKSTPSVSPSSPSSRHGGSRRRNVPGRVCIPVHTSLALVLILMAVIGYLCDMNKYAVVALSEPKVTSSGLLSAKENGSLSQGHGDVDGHGKVAIERAGVTVDSVISSSARSASESEAVSASLKSKTPLPPYGSPEYLAIFVQMNAKHNRWILSPFIPQKTLQCIPHPLQSWMRNLLSGTAMYFILSGLWSWYVYVVRGHVYFPDGGVPRTEDMLKQIRVSIVSMPIYSALPTLSEYMIEQGWTKSYHSINEVGWPTYFLLLVLYFLVIEFAVYWVHRILHDVKFLYVYLHATHHIYNKQNTLSPFAGLAFNPFDGIAQASPYVLALFILPIHAMTHELALFFSGVWATNIHDCIHGNVWPVMGAGYHTIHHTTYKHNYGHYTIVMDWIMGTLRDPLKQKAPGKGKEKGAGIKAE
ncbi:hypothetical protein CBR_g17142 [Chara braunii]|uniref:Fatty acid hydroxylase domain-containing protein n=1 Tax=Chara braunii TaxID=69332 RepID=A0A388KV32_CHABU|nr:hypothetical protein CBR_g17142 [Chara braunii]|eukprot:GBG73803.1 hypothetical protein CBR_g17142 [Chara braunii]